MGLRFINKSIIGDISNAIRWRAHENVDKKYTTEGMITRIGTIGTDMAVSNFQGGVFTPYASFNMANAYDGAAANAYTVCGENVTDMSHTYNGCIFITGSPVCGENVTNMTNAYADCRNITGSPVCGPNVTNMAYTYFRCLNLTGSPVCGPNVTNMYDTYHYCFNLTGSPVCGKNVVDMSVTYTECVSLTGSPVCGENVTNMSAAYANCLNLTGSPVCGPNVTNMYDTYDNCRNLTGSPVCGENVTNMSAAYRNCSNLTGLMLNSLISYDRKQIANAVYRAVNIKNFIVGSSSPINFNAQIIQIMINNNITPSYAFTDQTASENIWFNHLRTWNGYIDVDCGTSYQLSNVDDIRLFRAVAVREYNG